MKRDDFEAWMGATGYYGPEASTQWSTFRRRFKRFEQRLDRKTPTQPATKRRSHHLNRGGHRYADLDVWQG